MEIEEVVRRWRMKESQRAIARATLSTVDVATGWVACAGLRDRRQETVFHALQRLQADLPFRILGLDSNSGTEFINHVLLDHCTSSHGFADKKTAMALHV